MTTTTEATGADLSALIGQNEWARGCKHCQFGVAIHPDVEPLSIPLCIIRAFHWRHGILGLCDCPAGRNYELYLGDLWTKIENGSEPVPLTWSTALHLQIKAAQEAPTINGE